MKKAGGATRRRRRAGRTGRENVSTSATSLARWKLLIPSKVLNHISHGEARASEERFQAGGEDEEGEGNADDGDGGAGSEGDLDLGSWKPFLLLWTESARIPVIFMTPESISFESRDSSGTQSRGTRTNFSSDAMTRALIRTLVYVLILPLPGEITRGPRNSA